MIGFLLSRLGRAGLTIFLVMTFSFIVLRLSGDPALIIMSPDAPPEAIAAFRKSWGLDDPIWLQYLHYFGAVLEGELGRSMRDGRPAIQIVSERIPATLMLTLPALLLKVSIGIPAGVYAALHRNSRIDRVVMSFAVFGFTVPSFVLALVLVLVFSVWLGWLPTSGADTWRHAILPVVTLGIGGAAVLARYDEREDDAGVSYRPGLPREMVNGPGKKDRVMKWLDNRPVYVKANERFIVETAPQPPPGEALKIKKKGSGGASPNFK